MEVGTAPKGSAVGKAADAKVTGKAKEPDIKRVPTPKTKRGKAPSNRKLSRKDIHKERAELAPLRFHAPAVSLAAVMQRRVLQLLPPRGHEQRLRAGWYARRHGV